MIRKPAVSGRFYPQNPSELLATIKKSYLSELGPQSIEFTNTRAIRAMIVPHAGYVFSGPVAAWGYARLKAEKQLPENILLLGPKHTALGEKFAVSASSAWHTPLGDIKVNAKLAKLFVDSCSHLKLDSSAHCQEHSLEVQLPFLQELYQDNDFSIIPVAIGFSSFSEIRAIANCLKDIIQHIDEELLILISSDFSHDISREDAYHLDNEAIEYILRLDAEGFYRLVISEGRSICGVMPICVALEIFRAEQSKVRASKLKYATSMDVMKHDRGVGYASIVFEV